MPPAEAMPVDAMSFAPTGGDFKGARTFRDQAMHIGAALYIVSGGVLG